MKCSYCGQILRDDAQFCSNCGHSTEITVKETAKKKKSEKGAYALSILSLMIVLALMAYGCYVIISRDLLPTGEVSSSDEPVTSFNYESVVADPSLEGKWTCTDRAAADYSDKNFGIEVKAILTLTNDGKFTLDYTMTDTGIQAMTLNTSGTYSTDNGVITFRPEETAGTENYLKKHGSSPSFPYSADKSSFTLKYENGKDIVFSKVKEKK